METRLEIVWLKTKFLVTLPLKIRGRRKARVQTPNPLTQGTQKAGGGDPM